MIVGLHRKTDLFISSSDNMYVHIDNGSSGFVRVTVHPGK